MKQDTVDNIASYFWGKSFALLSIVTMGDFFNMAFVSLKAVFFGIIGGFAGMLGKALYKRLFDNNANDDE